ncbi:uncharacterized protein LOC113760461 [Coffea eugenioides]|uniref:uncharacterized protein LOC113760461 n=1 Tax=Coffea eugenioides TaxID=49369 RepID=UPI000F60481D|nr:uncharacterized protein LOC113760461 [Coffea eugenioides]XP_027158843.1 uncharacterized protein LOC113760461 [Coffea eugenioides]
MATAVTTPPPPSSSSSSCGPKLESLANIDITKLSQSELYTLSKCSNSAFDLHRSDDVVVPNIDRSLFNESSGSRRQTYSRLRQSHHHHHHLHPRTRLPGLLPGPKHSPSADPENHAILHYLKHYLNHNSATNCPPPPPPPPLPPRPPPPPPQPVGLGLQEKMAIAVNVVEKKRKRGGKVRWNPGLLENGVGMELERVNKNGLEVDFAALESNGDEFYSAELGRRTMGLETEEGVLEFLRGLEGQWCSRRKKRKYVDAGDFGDALPIGWKLLLGLRRRDGRVWVYCRRIISPIGEQFLSCKEASSFLRSYFEAKSSSQPVDQGNSIVEQGGAVASRRNAGSITNAYQTSHEIVPYLTASGGHDNDVGLMDIDNLPEVQVQDLFECYKCNLTFDEKNLYLQHLMSFHQRTTRRYKFGDAVADGVIIKDGKFECQFCHKVFLERRSYNGHVGVHVRNHVKGSELPTPDSVQKSVDSPSWEGLCRRTSKNALIEIAHNFTSAASSAGPSSAAVEISHPSVINLNETLAGNTHVGATLVSEPSQLEGLNAGRTLNLDLNQHKSDSFMDDGRMSMCNNRQAIEINLKEVHTKDAEQSDAEELKEYGNKNVEIGFGPRSSKQSDDVANSEGPMGEETVHHSGISSSSTPLVQAYDYFSSVPDKGDDEFFLESQKLGNLPSFEELELDYMGPFKYDFADGQESSLPEVSRDLASDTGKGEVLNASVGLDSQADQLNMTGTHQFTTVCVWCRSEFKIEAFDSELQSDSIGYMCTTCKDKISGHFSRICH